MKVLMLRRIMWWLLGHPVVAVAIIVTLMTVIVALVWAAHAQV